MKSLNTMTMTMILLVLAMAFTFATFGYYHGKDVGREWTMKVYDSALREGRYIKLPRYNQPIEYDAFVVYRDRNGFAPDIIFKNEQRIDSIKPEEIWFRSNEFDDYLNARFNRENSKRVRESLSDLDSFYTNDPAHPVIIHRGPLYIMEGIATSSPFR